MTFGAERWGAGTRAARQLFDTYVEAGGNYFDTADAYSGGRSEERLGSFVAEAGLRDSLVIATKSGFARSQGTPLHGGNGAKNIRLGIEGSLKRLTTDYIDMYWMHVWDRTTPAEEVLQTLRMQFAAVSTRPAGSRCDRLRRKPAFRSGPCTSAPVNIKTEPSRPVRRRLSRACSRAGTD